MMRLSAPIYQLKRRVKLLARDQNIPLYQTQASIAADEGFMAWSLLAAHASQIPMSMHCTTGFRALADPLPEATPEIIATHDICTHSITIHLAGSPKGTVAMIDYLQNLDQRRSTPPLSEQVEVLKLSFSKLVSF